MVFLTICSTARNPSLQAKLSVIQRNLHSRDLQMFQTWHSFHNRPIMQAHVLTLTKYLAGHVI